MDVKTTFRNLVRDQSVSICMLQPPPAALLAAATGGPAVAAVARIAANQRSCQETLKAAHSSSLQLQHMDMQGERVICDTSTGQPRPLIPVADRRDVFRAVHELAHAGIRATRRLMAARVVWRGFRRGRVVPRLPALCTWQGQPTTHCSCPAHTSTGAALYPRARGPGWASPCISGGVQVPVHYGGQVIQVAGCRPSEVHGG